VSSAPSLGQEIVTERRTITEADVVLYAGLSGDFHPAHTDEVYAVSSVFGKRVVHGLLTLSLSQGLLMRTGLRNYISALIGIDKVKFLFPVYPSDTVRSVFRVAELRPSKEKPAVWIMVLHAEVYKEPGNRVVLEYESAYIVSKANDGQR
jgi:acyl dehydratase